VMSKIYLIRGQKVMLDMDLAGLYDVETKQLKRAVRRNSVRFPDDFMFELSKLELDSLRSQIGTSSWVVFVMPLWHFQNRALQCYQVY
jgi:hypothetical protein